MKTLLSTVCLLITIQLLQGCAEQEDVRKAGVRFSFHENDNLPLVLPSDHSIYISIESDNGSAVLTDLKTEFTFDGTSYLSEEIHLPEGNYFLKELSIKSNDEIFYRSSHESSMNRFLVAGATNYVQVALKKVHEKKVTLELGALSEEGQYLSATANLKVDTTVIHTLNLNEGLNTFTLSIDPKAVYSIEVFTDGYAKSIIPISFKHIRNEPLIVTLREAFTFTVYVPELRKSNFKIDIGMTPGTINIDFGDGTKAVRTVPGDTYPIFLHTYEHGGYYDITITGDLHSIAVFRPTYYQEEFSTFDFRHLDSLKVFNLGQCDGPSIMDFSKNSNLEELVLMGVRDLEKIILPMTHHIFVFDASGPNQLNTEAVDAIISNLHRNTVEQNIRYGDLYLTPAWWDRPAGWVMVGPPSPESVAKVYDMHDNFGWWVLNINEAE